MEGRKLQLAGGSTYLVSLPKRWVLNAGLKAGDTLFVDTETDGTVSVRPHAAEKTAARRKIFLSLLLEDLTTRGRLLRCMGAHGDGAVRFGIDKEGVPGLQAGVQDPALGQRNQVR